MSYVPTCIHCQQKLGSNHNCLHCVQHQKNLAFMFGQMFPEQKDPSREKFLYFDEQRGFYER